jgi:uncharacterized protein YkwD
MQPFRRLIVAAIVCLWCLQAGGGEDKKKFELSPAEKKLLDLTNRERKKQDLPPLEADPLLCKIARGHSANMAKQAKPEHNLDGKTPFDRLRDAGYDYRFAGENVAFGLNFSVAEIVEGLMDSPKHRDNILHKQFTHIGLGAFKDKGGTIWYTQVFAKPKAK